MEHIKLNYVVWLCKKTARKTALNVLWHSTGFPPGLSVFVVSSVCLLVRMTSWCRQVNWGNCGVPCVNCAVFYVKDGWKGRSWGLRYCLSKLRSFLCEGMTSHSKIAQINGECIGRCRQQKGQKWKSSLNSSCRRLGVPQRRSLRCCEQFISLQRTEPRTSGMSLNELSRLSHSKSSSSSSS
jgi:hypothetical protein